MNGQSSMKLTGKMGKEIEIYCEENNPKVIEFKILSNRGTVKDTIQFKVDEVIDALRFITVMNEAYNKE